MKELIRKYALQNAVKFNGKANPGAIVGKLIAEDPSVKDKMKELGKEISAIVKEVNSMPLEKQHAELERIAPEMLEKKEHKEKDIFGFLKLTGRVVTAFPPEPSKYPHIGHAKALLLNYEMAKQHDGKFVLRFEDTNPSLVKKEYYDIHLENYKWLGVKPDKIDYASNHMKEFYDAATKLIRQGKAYVCKCVQDEIKKHRFEGTECACRNTSIEENLALFAQMQNMKEGDAIVRLKIDMNHPNTTMRDPAIMRIIDEAHPLLGRKYRIWPTYDFETSIMDGIEGITHRLRSKEFEMRNELQRFIQKSLGYPETEIYEFARFNMEGVESSGRVIREKIAQKELVGWDDPSLTTLVALRRRGFLPEAIKQFVLHTGITKAESTLTWDDLIVHNKRILDKESDRYFFVVDPVRITVKNAPSQEVKLKLHPELPERGYRVLKTHEEFYISKDDHENIDKDKLYRLMDCLNFRNFEFDSLEYENYKNNGARIMHWLPVLKELVSVEVLMPDKSVRKGLAEPDIKKVKVGQVIQFERFGFCRMDSKNRFWFTH